MNLSRVYAIILRHYFLATHQIERFFDIFFFPVFALLLWGFLANYVRDVQSPSITSFLLGGIILWIIFERVGTDIGMSFMFDVWERNVINILATPITFAEYLTGLVLISIAKIIISFGAMWALAAVFYDFKITILGTGLALLWVNLVIFALAFGIFNISLVLRYGHAVGPLTWILPFLLQPIAAGFYPVSILPDFLQKIAWILPLSHVFEGMRYSLKTGQFDFNQFMTASLLNLIYFSLSIIFFARIFNTVKKNGRLVKLN